MRRPALLLLSGALASLGLMGVAGPAQATHMCDPSIEIACTHPERELDDMLDLLCDKFVVVDKIVGLVGECGSN